MANCPKCKKEWRWDWKQDSYRDEKKKFVSEMEFDLPDIGESITIYQCVCGKVLGVMSSIGEVTTIDEWKDIDWEDKKHIYDSDWLMSIKNECKKQAKARRRK